MLILPAQEQTRGLSGGLVCWWSPWCQLRVLPGTAPVLPVHQLSSPAFSHSWESLPALWLRMSCLQVCSMLPASVAWPRTVLMELFTNRSWWLLSHCYRWKNGGQEKGLGWSKCKSFVHPTALPPPQACLG